MNNRNKRNRIKRYNLVQSKLSLPYPPPDLLKKYNDIDDGAGKKIIQNGLKESNHRRSIDNERMDLNLRILKHSTRYNTTSLWMGFIIAIIMIIVTVYLIINNHYVFGVLSGGVATSLISMFLYDKPKSPKIKKSK